MSVAAPLAAWSFSAPNWIVNKQYEVRARAFDVAGNISTTSLVSFVYDSTNPVVTAITGWFAELLAGAFFVEYIFGWKGIGKVTVDALEKLDFPVVMGSVLVTATFFILINILADILYGVIDPRVTVH